MLIFPLERLDEVAQGDDGGHGRDDDKRNGQRVSDTEHNGVRHGNLSSLAGGIARKRLHFK
jgi:hypothetical protein